MWVGWWACFYRRNCEEHDYELLFAKDGVADEGVGEAGEATTAFFDEKSVGRDVVAINGHSLWRQ